MRLLIEEPEFDSQKIITEGEGKDKKLFVEGPFSFAGTKNRNGRIYPVSILDREIEKFQALVEARQAVGELDHPDSPKLNLKNISHRIVKIQKEGKDAYVGKAHILRSQPSGAIAAGLIEDGVQLGISSRALGSLKQTEDAKVVQDDLNLITWDLVARPSFDKALVNAIYESKEYEKVGDAIIERVLDPKLKEEELLELLESFKKEAKRWRDLYYGKVLLENLERRLS